MKMGITRALRTISKLRGYKDKDMAYVMGQSKGAYSERMRKNQWTFEYVTSVMCKYLGCELILRLDNGMEFQIVEPLSEAHRKKIEEYQLSHLEERPDTYPSLEEMKAPVIVE